MTKENEGGEEDVLLEDLPGEPGEGEEDKTDWKAVAQKNHGIAQRLKTKLEKAKEKPAEPKNPVKDKENKSEGLDRVDRAVLRAEKITDADEVKLVEDTMKETGKDLESVLASKYFQAELKELRELNASRDAIPAPGSRSGEARRDSVDYWIAKGELPPKDQPELRQKVVNAKIAKQKSANQFSDNPIS